MIVISNFYELPMLRNELRQHQNGSFFFQYEYFFVFNWDSVDNDNNDKAAGTLSFH